MKPTIVDDVFQCPACGGKTPFEDLDFSASDSKVSLMDDATMTCPVCNSKYAISAVLTEPGTVPEPDAAPEMPIPGDEEVVADEEEVVVEPDAEAAPGDEDQITPKESVSKRVERAMELLKDGKPSDLVMTSLLSAPMKVHSIKRVRMAEGRGKVIDLTPSVSQYRHMLQIVKANSTSRADKAWAKDELDRIAGVKQWRSSPEKPNDPLPGKRSFQDPDLAAGRPRNERAGLSKAGDKVIEASAADLRGFELNSGDSFINELGYSIYFSPEGYIEITKDGKIVADFYPEDITLELEAAKPGGGTKILEKDEKKDWEGDFANFNSKLFGCADDLAIPIDKIEVIIADLQEKDALSLNNDKVTLDLDKAKNCFVDFLKGQVIDAEVQARATDIAEPPPVAQDLGNGSAPATVPALPLESRLKEEDAGEGNKETVEDQVERILAKYFA